MPDIIDHNDRPRRTRSRREIVLSDKVHPLPDQISAILDEMRHKQNADRPGIRPARQPADTERPEQAVDGTDQRAVLLLFCKVVALQEVIANEVSDNRR